MHIEILSAIFLPFLGTVLGSAYVFIVKDKINQNLQRSLTGFAAGVMVAASIWSLIIPAMEQSEHLGKLAFLPAAVGVWGGFLFLLVLDRIIPHLHINGQCPEGTKCKIYLPWNLAYGKSGNRGIPPYSALIFDIEIMRVVKAKK